MKTLRRKTTTPEVGSLWISCCGPVLYTGYRKYDGDYYNATLVSQLIMLNITYYSFAIENGNTILVIDVNEDARTVDILVGLKRETVVWKNILTSSHLRRLDNKNKKQLPFFTIYEYEKFASSKIYQRKYSRQLIRARQVRVYKRVQRCSRGT